MSNFARVEDLLEPLTREAALRECSDEQLFIAAVARNAEPVLSVMDMHDAARELAEYAHHAESEAGFERLLREALCNLPANLVVTELLHLGSSPTGPKEPYAALAVMRRGVLTATVVSEHLLQQPRLLRQEEDMLEKLVLVAHDSDLAFALQQKTFRASHAVRVLAERAQGRLDA